MLQGFLNQFAGDLAAICTLGRFSRFLPEDFETTGITILVAMSNIGIIGGNLLAALELDLYSVHPGYFLRVIRPMFLNFFFAIFLMLVLPLFLPR